VCCYRQWTVTVCRENFMLKIALTFLFVVIPVLSHGTTDKEPVSKRKGVKPLLGGGCPADYPIKGNFTTYSGERCIYHLPGQRFYNKTMLNGVMQMRQMPNKMAAVRRKSNEAACS
jgi:hypothetical protein